MERTFEVYSRLVADITGSMNSAFPDRSDDSNVVWKSTIRAKACDTVRGLLPASTLSNVGIYGTGQAYEMALMRMQAHPGEESGATAEMMLDELRKVIPSFLTRVDLPTGALPWSKYLADVRENLEELAPRSRPNPRPRRPR